MNPDSLTAAIAEAERFIERASAARDAFEWRKFNNITGGYWNNTNTVLSAAARRASMDLTRALADVRRPA
ncbi:hypothetical protein [Sphingobium chungbukense]|uniref:Uncharacterized protein n=1 Tax=Sphingobium chungbukense TaxID=56193 RepID=A0A0M3AVN9_9SPHN|nr:hypothetical protein [Sphingobium chungbukense]KKW92644.1 hypothetical protein YP76_06825 [Sphingobium chungbukense]